MTSIWRSRTCSCLKRKLSRMLKMCTTVSFPAVIWVLVLILLISTLMLNSSLQERERRLALELEKARLLQMDKPEEEKTTKPPIKFDPFVVPGQLHDAKVEQLLVEASDEKEVNIKEREVDIKVKTNDDKQDTGQINDAKEKKSVRAEKKVENKNSKTFLINWYNPPPYLRLKPGAFNLSFDACEYNNCIMSKDRKDREKSDAVLFDGRWVFEKVGFKRPPGQVWVFAAHESPLVYEELGTWWKQPQWRHGFNWTMTYDKDNTDIFLPYGELRKHTKPVVRDFKAITKQKTQSVLMISSHCPTLSYREDYVKKLSQFVPVDILGKCGTPWNCGTHYVHDDCFNILNTTYKFFLAFENALCHQYFSEKIFENFNYDIIIVVRGGSYGEAKSLFPKHTIIPTDQFRSIEGLGRYLGKLSWSVNDYAEMLKIKSQYYFPGYTPIYQRALCEICERMNNLDKYAKRIPDIVEWAYGKNPCRNATDLN